MFHPFNINYMQQFRSLLQVRFSYILIIFLAKSIELDERIPFIPRLKRKCEIKDSIQDIKYAELKVLEACDWNPLYSTVLEVLEFYLC